MITARAVAATDPQISLSVVLAVFALVVSVGSAVSQVILWRLSGPRVVVDWKWAEIRGKPGRAIGITARNRGRGPTTIERFGFVCEEDVFDSFLVMSQIEPWRTKVPHRLEPHSAVSWYFHSSDILGRMPADTMVLRPFVVDASGERLRAKLSLAPADLAA